MNAFKLMRATSHKRISPLSCHPWKWLHFAVCLPLFLFHFYAIKMASWQYSSPWTIRVVSLVDGVSYWCTSSCSGTNWIEWLITFGWDVYEGAFYLCIQSCATAHGTWRAHVSWNTWSSFLRRSKPKSSIRMIQQCYHWWIKYWTFYPPHKENITQCELLTKKLKDPK